MNHTYLFFREYRAHEDKSYTGTYLLRQSGDIIYQMDCFSKNGIWQRAEMTDKDGNAVASVRAEYKNLSMQYIISEQASGSKENEVVNIFKNHKLYNADGKALAVIKDPTSLIESTVRTMLAGDIEQWVIELEGSNKVIADISINKIKKKFPWPLSIIEAIFKALLSNKKALYSITKASNDIPLSTLCFLAAYLHSLKGTVYS